MLSIMVFGDGMVKPLRVVCEAPINIRNDCEAKILGRFLLIGVERASRAIVVRKEVFYGLHPKDTQSKETEKRPPVV